MTAFSPLPAIFFPLLSRTAAREQFDEVRTRVLDWTRLSLAPAIATGAIAWILLPIVIPLLFGSRFDFAVQPARYLVIAALIRGSTAWSKVLAFAVGRPGVSFATTSFDAALLIGATWWLASQGSATLVALAHCGVAALVSIIYIKFAASLGEAHARSRE